MHTPVVCKGKFGDLQITMWDVCDECHLNECPIYDRCSYSKRQGMKCQVQMKYLGKVIDAILTEYQEVLDDASMTRFGFEVIPLYGHLIKFKIAEMGFSSPVYFDEKGNPRVNPIYREIRGIISAIGGAHYQVAGTKKKGEVGKLAIEIGDDDYVASLLTPTDVDKEELDSPMEAEPVEEEKPKKKKGRKVKKNAKS